PKPPKVETIENGFTVAKDGTGQYKTIGEALEKVDRPGMTILILDDAVYTEVVEIRNRSKHEGLTLESRRGATLACPEKARVGMVIMNVPGVAVRGLVLRGAQTISVLVAGHSPGVVLEGLDCSSTSAVRTTGLVLRTALQGEDAPVLVRNCRISGFDNGIEIVGMDAKSVAVPCGRLIFRDNRIEECDIGIWAAGQINDALIVGNRLVGCFTASMRLDLIA